MLQSNKPNIFAREMFCGISFVGTGLKKKRAVRVTGERARVRDSIEPRGQGRKRRLGNTRNALRYLVIAAFKNP